MNPVYKFNNNNSQSSWNAQQSGRPQGYRNSGPRPPRQRNSFSNSKDQRSHQDHHDRSDNRNSLDGKGRSRNCPKHSSEFQNKVCMHPGCLSNGAMCDACVMEDIIHSTEHKNLLLDIDTFLDTADEIFQKQKKVIIDNKLVPTDLLVFLETEDKKVNDYIEHTKKQKRIIEEHSGALIKAFIELVQDKLTEIKTIFDLQLDTYCKNYKIVAEKIRVLYQSCGVSVFSVNASKERIIDFEKFIKEIKQQVVVIDSIKNQSEGLKKKVYEDEILTEIRKGLEKVEHQGNFPLKLDHQREDKSGMNTSLNFYASYKVLMKDIEKAFEVFSTSLTPVDRVEEFEDNNFHNLEQGLINSDIAIESSIYVDHRQKENFKTKKTQDKQLYNNSVWAENYFQLDCKNKMIVSFEGGGPFYHFFLFRNITPFMVEDSIDSSCETKQLNIDFFISRNHASIITQNGRAFICGGIIDETGPIDTVYELNSDDHDQTLSVKASMNFKRFSHAICSLGNERLMVAGGRSIDNRTMDTCEIYDMREDKWYNVARMNKPGERFCMTMFGVNYVYKFGGYPDSVAERYNLKMNRWELLNVKIPMDMHINCECVQINLNQILIFGGPNDSQYYFMNIVDSETGLVESISEVEPMKFKLQGDSVYFGCQKSVVTYNRRIYAYDSGKQRIISYSGQSGWKISEGL